MQLISFHIPEGKMLALIWHFDKFHHLPQALLKKLLVFLGTAMFTEKIKHQIAIIPVFTGTASIQIAKDIRASAFGYKDIFLQQLR